MLSNEGDDTSDTEDDVGAVTYRVRQNGRDHPYFTSDQICMQLIGEKDSGVNDELTQCRALDTPGLATWRWLRMVGSTQEAVDRAVGCLCDGRWLDDEDGSDGGGVDPPCARDALELLAKNLDFKLVAGDVCGRIDVPEEYGAQIVATPVDPSLCARALSAYCTLHKDGKSLVRAEELPVAEAGLPGLSHVVARVDGAVRREGRYEGLALVKRSATPGCIDSGLPMAWAVEAQFAIAAFKSALRSQIDYCDVLHVDAANNGEEITLQMWRVFGGEPVGMSMPSFMKGAACQREFPKVTLVEQVRPNLIPLPWDGASCKAMASAAAASRMYDCHDFGGRRLCTDLKHAAALDAVRLNNCIKSLWDAVALRHYGDKGWLRATSLEVRSTLRTDPTLGGVVDSCAFRVDRGTGELVLVQLTQLCRISWKDDKRTLWGPPGGGGFVREEHRAYASPCPSHAETRDPSLPVCDPALRWSLHDRMASGSPSPSDRKRPQPRSGSTEVSKRHAGALCRGIAI